MPVVRHSRISSEGEKMAYAVNGNLRRIEQEVQRTDSILFHVDSGLKHFWKHVSSCTRSLDEEEEWVWGGLDPTQWSFMLTGNYERKSGTMKTARCFQPICNAADELYMRVHNNFFREKSSFIHIVKCRKQSPILWMSGLEVVVWSMSVSLCQYTIYFSANNGYNNLLDLRFPSPHTFKGSPRWQTLTSWYENTPWLCHNRGRPLISDLNIARLGEGSEWRLDIT